MRPRSRAPVRGAPGTRPAGRDQRGGSGRRANARFLVDGWVAERLGSAFPYGTLVINVSGSLVLGIVLTLASERLSPDWFRPALAIGFLGSYTTFSTFSYETLAFVADGSFGLAAVNVGASVTAALLGTGWVSCWAGPSEGGQRVARHRAQPSRRGPRRRERPRRPRAALPGGARVPAGRGRLGRDGHPRRGGFGHDSRIHTANILRLSLDLPLVLVWIDAPARTERLLPGLRRLAGPALITVEEVDIVVEGGRSLTG